MLRFIICESYRSLRSKKQLKMSINVICFRKVFPFVCVCNFRFVRLSEIVCMLHFSMKIVAVSGCNYFLKFQAFICLLV